MIDVILIGCSVVVGCCFVIRGGLALWTVIFFIILVFRARVGWGLGLLRCLTGLMSYTFPRRLFCCLRSCSSCTLFICGGDWAFWSLFASKSNLTIY